MVRTTEGTFISCDEPIKQFLRNLDQTHKFILRDLGEGQLFIKSDKRNFVKEEVEKFLDQHTFKRPELA
ncbi:unnamed protein product [Blepharisma stoltei]|uniref:General transcription and DNA repair factor IIH subunit TFB5 n=1 Tax=Blepharisma stoltei TaxID=1481888 RepID=A0AAU9JVK0_9CILI|nr:unnamed protein product [Blepharisma stoltei]